VLKLKKNNFGAKRLIIGSRAIIASIIYFNTDKRYIWPTQCAYVSSGIHYK